MPTSNSSYSVEAPQATEQVATSEPDAAQESIAGRDEKEMLRTDVQRDLTRFHELIRPYEHRLYAFSLRIVKNEADAEEVVQETCLNAMRNLASFRGEASFSTWLFSIALNECRSRLRRSKLARHESLDESINADGEPLYMSVLDPNMLASELVERHESLSLLRRAIGRLPAIYRQVIEMRYVRELSMDETARLIGITVASVKVRSHRGKTMLQKMMTPGERKRFVRNRTNSGAWPARAVRVGFDRQPERTPSNTATP
jgi:RNA polymerase sigma-70 factor (ECF subfamily)